MNTQQLAQYGRHGDDTLVHMGRDELAGLDALARAQGGAITINPHTGLPEAFSLKKVFKSIAPMIAGGLLSLIPGVGPFMAAGMVGGATGLASGSLKKGLMAGLGAYGGAGIANSLSTAGAAANASGATTAGTAGTAAEQTAKYGTQLADIPNVGGTLNVPTSTANIGAGVRTLSSPLEGIKGLANAASYNVGETAGSNQLMKYGAAAAAPMLAGSGTSSGPDAPPQQDATYYPYDFSWNQTAGDTMGGAQTYVRPEFTAREPYTQTAAAGGTIYGNSGIGALAGGGATDMAVDPYDGTPSYKSGGTTAVKPTTTIPKYNYDPQTRQFSAASSAPAPMTTTRVPTPGYGDVNPETGMSGASSDVYEYLMGRRPVSAPRSPVQIINTPAPVPPPTPATAATPATAQPSATPNIPFQVAGMPSQDVIQALLAQYGYTGQGYAGGGRLVKGAGDGVSDSIPAVIHSAHGDQPAKLAADEFVIPAPAVAAIGNGSSDAGAKRLYAMLDRIEQRARSAERGKDSGAWRELPA